MIALLIFFVIIATGSGGDVGAEHRDLAAQRGPVHDRLLHQSSCRHACWRPGRSTSTCSRRSGGSSGCASTGRSWQAPCPRPALFLLLMVVAQRYLPDSVLVDNLTFYLALVAVLRFTVLTILWWIERIVITDKRVMLAAGHHHAQRGHDAAEQGHRPHLPAHPRRPHARLRHADRRVGGADPGAQPDRVHAPPRGDLRGALRAGVRREGQDARDRACSPARAGGADRPAPVVSLRGVGRPRIDLHTHSTASDGTDSAGRAGGGGRGGRRGRAGASPTTTPPAAGTRRRRRCPAGMRWCAAPSSPASARPAAASRDVSVHLLGYLFDPEHQAIVAEQARLRTERSARLRRMTEKMAADGYPVDVETVFALLPDGRQRRPPAPGPRAGRARAWSSRWTRRSRTLLYNGSPYYVAEGRHARGDGDRDGAGGRRGGGVRAPAGPPSRPGGGAVGDRRAGRRSGWPAWRWTTPTTPRRTATCCAGWRRSWTWSPPGSSDYHGTNKTTPIAAETTDPAQFEALVARATRASRSSPADRPPRSPAPFSARSATCGRSCAVDARVGTNWPANVASGALGTAPSVHSRASRADSRAPAGPAVPGCGRHYRGGVDGGTQLGLDGWIPRSRPGRWCGSRRPGSRRGPTAPAATG